MGYLRREEQKHSGLTILCDLDAILADILTAWMSWYNFTYPGENVTVGDLKSYGTANCVKRGERVYDWIESRNMYDTVRPVPGSLYHFNKLREEGHHVVIVSAPSKSVHSATAKMEWIQRHIPELYYKDVMVTSLKHLVKGDVLIDDGPNNVTKYRKAWPNALICSIRYPYHSEPGFDASVYDILAGDWNHQFEAWVQIYKAINDYAAQKQLAANY